MTADNWRRLSGAALVLLSAFAWSVNGLYARLLSIDIWTTLVGRAIATALALFVALALINRGRTWDVLVANTRRGVWVILFGAVTMIAFVAALFKTTVANVTVIYSISPLMAAVLARFLIGDRLVARTLLAFAAALAGVVVIVGGSFGSARLVGDFLALVMSTTFAFVMVEMRRKPDIDNTATSLLSSVLLVLALWPIADLGDVTGRDAVILFLFGITSNVLGFFSFIAGVRRHSPGGSGIDRHDRGRAGAALGVAVLRREPGRGRPRRRRDRARRHSRADLGRDPPRTRRRGRSRALPSSKRRTSRPFCERKSNGRRRAAGVQ